MSGSAELQKRIQTLEKEVERLERVTEALMDRVERSTDEAGSSYSLFESNLLLQNKIKEHSGKLIRINRDLQREIGERKRVEDVLKKERDFTSAVVDTSGALVVVLDKKGKIVRFNKTCEDTTGYSFEDVKMKHVWDLFLVPEEVDKVKGVFEELKAGFFPNQAENYWVTKDGRHRLIAWSNTAICDDDGNVQHIIGTGIDVTEHKEAEEALYESEEKYRLLVENANEGILVAQENKLEFVNSKVMEITGFSREELKTKPFAEFIHPDDREWVIERYLKRLKGETVSPISVFRITDTHGTILWVEVNAVLITWKGHPATLNFLDDITERRQAEEELKLYHRIFMASSDGISIVDPLGKIVEMNPAQQRYVGQTCGMAIGEHVSTGLDKADAETILRSIEKTNQFRGEIKFPGEEGFPHYVDLSIFPIYNDAGELACYVGMGRDITDLKRALNDLADANTHLRETQAQLVQSEKMASMGMLVAGVAHEINTPMGSINSMHDTLMRATNKLSTILSDAYNEDDSKYGKIQAILKIIDDANRVIQDGTGRVTTIVRRLRSFARLDEAEMDKYDLHEGLEDTLTLIHHEIKHHINVDRRYGEIPRIYCSLSQLNQVFLNLLINAKQAIQGKGEITITTSLRRDQVILEFEDTGTGIAKENLAKIFDPGYTTKGVGVGTGLGLSICYQIIHDHHGEIKVESEVGVGTKFTVILPTNLDEILGES